MWSELSAKVKFHWIPTNSGTLLVFLHPSSTTLVAKGMKVRCICVSVQNGRLGLYRNIRPRFQVDSGWTSERASTKFSLVKHQLLARYSTTVRVTGNSPSFIFFCEQLPRRASWIFAETPFSETRTLRLNHWDTVNETRFNEKLSEA